MSKYLENLKRKISETKAAHKRITKENSQELAELLQTWFDKHQPEAKRDFRSLLGNKSERANCKNISEHAMDWFYYGN